MSPKEVCSWLLDGGGIIMLDTNANWGPAQWIREAARKIAILNESLSRLGKSEILLRVSALVYTEKLFDMHQEYKQIFNINVVHELFDYSGIEVLEFGQSDAERTAKMLGAAFGTSSKWHNAKRTRFFQHLGLPESEKPEITGKNLPGTIDWFIAGHAYGARILVVTNDQGNEWNAVEHCNLATFRNALTEAAGAPP